MTTQQRALLAALETNTWEVIEKDTTSIEWWPDEIWVVKHQDSTPETVLYLAFVVDPQWDGPRLQGAGIWAVTAAPDAPQQWSKITLSLGRGWEQQLPQFIAALSREPPTPNL